MWVSETFRRLGRNPWFRGVGSWSVYLVIAVVASWPLCRSASTTISIGFESEATVPLLNIWTLWWNSDRLAACLRGYWNAPIFYPTKGTFAFSEAQPTMMLVAPVVWLTGSRVLAYNVYQLLILSLNGFSSQRLLRRIGHRPWLAFCGGVMCQMLPFAWWQMGVVQLTTVFGIVWTIHALLDCFDPAEDSRRPATRDDMPFRASARPMTDGNGSESGGDDSAAGSPGRSDAHWSGSIWPGSVGRGLRLGGAFSVTYLLCNYWGMYLALLLVPGSLWLWNAEVFRWRFWAAIGLAAAVAAAVLGPVIGFQRSLAREHQWTRDQGWIRDLSAHPRDYLDTPQTPPAGQPKSGLVDENLPESLPRPDPICWSLVPAWDAPEDQRSNLWPLGGGHAKLWLVPIGLLGSLATRGRRRWGLFAATFGAVAFGLSLGPAIGFAGWIPGLAGVCPFELLQQYVPGFALIRSPFRFALFVQLAVVWLAVEALDLLSPARWAKRSLDEARSAPAAERGWVSRLPATLRHEWFWGPQVVISLLVLVEVWPPRQSLFECPSESISPAWVLWLRENSAPDDAVVCLPFPTGYTVRDYDETTIWMFWGTLHRRRLVNGYSGFFPATFVDLKDKLSHFYRADNNPAVRPQLKLYPWDSPGLHGLNNSGARFAIVKRSFATRDDVWQHPITKFRWSWVTADETHQLDIYEILQPEPQ